MGKKKRRTTSDSEALLISAFVAIGSGFTVTESGVCGWWSGLNLPMTFVIADALTLPWR